MTMNDRMEVGNKKFKRTNTSTKTIKKPNK